MYTFRKVFQMWLRRFLLREPVLMPASSGVTAPVSAQAGLRGSQAEGGPILAAQAGAWPGSRAHSLLCRALPVSRRRWVLLVRVALGGFLVESWARRGCFLFTFLRLCACSDAVREEILQESGTLVRLGE